MGMAAGLRLVTWLGQRERFDVDLVLQNINDPEFPVCVKRDDYMGKSTWLLAYQMKNKDGKLSGALNYGKYEKDFGFGDCVALGEVGCKLTINNRPEYCAKHVCHIMARENTNISEQHAGYDFLKKWSDPNIQSVMHDVVDTLEVLDILEKRKGT